MDPQSSEIVNDFYYEYEGAFKKSYQALAGQTTMNTCVALLEEVLDAWEESSTMLEEVTIKRRNHVEISMRASSTNVNKYSVVQWTAALINRMYPAQQIRRLIGTSMECFHQNGNMSLLNYMAEFCKNDRREAQLGVNIMILDILVKAMTFLHKELPVISPDARDLIKRLIENPIDSKFLHANSINNLPSSQLIEQLFVRAIQPTTKLTAYMEQAASNVNIASPAKVSWSVHLLLFLIAMQFNLSHATDIVPYCSTDVKVGQEAFISMTGFTEVQMRERRRNEEEEIENSFQHYQDLSGPLRGKIIIPDIYQLNSRVFSSKMAMLKHNYEMARGKLLKLDENADIKAERMRLLNIGTRKKVTDEWENIINKYLASIEESDDSYAYIQEGSDRFLVYTKDLAKYPVNEWIDYLTNTTVNQVTDMSHQIGTAFEESQRTSLATYIMQSKLGEKEKEEQLAIAAKTELGNVGVFTGNLLPSEMKSWMDGQLRFIQMFGRRHTKPIFIIPKQEETKIRRTDEYSTTAQRSPGPYEIAIVYADPTAMNPYELANEIISLGGSLVNGTSGQIQVVEIRDSNRELSPDPSRAALLHPFLTYAGSVYNATFGNTPAGIAGSLSTESGELAAELVERFIDMQRHQFGTASAITSAYGKDSMLMYVIWNSLENVNETEAQCVAAFGNILHDLHTEVFTIDNLIAAFSKLEDTEHLSCPAIYTELEQKLPELLKEPIMDVLRQNKLDPEKVFELFKLASDPKTLTRFEQFVSTYGKVNFDRQSASVNWVSHHLFANICNSADMGEIIMACATEYRGVPFDTTNPKDKFGRMINVFTHSDSTPFDGKLLEGISTADLKMFALAIKPFFNLQDSELFNTPDYPAIDGIYQGFLIYSSGWRMSLTLVVVVMTTVGVIQSAIRLLTALGRRGIQQPREEIRFRNRRR